MHLSTICASLRSMIAHAYIGIGATNARSAVGISLALALVSTLAAAQAPSPHVYQPMDVEQVRAANDLYDQAIKAYSDQEFEKAADLFAQAFGAGFDLPEIAYSAGSSYARAGDRVKAFEYLDRAVAKGYAGSGQVKSDSDLNSLHADPRWQRLLRQVENNQRDAQEQATKIWDTPVLGTTFRSQLSDAEKIAGLSKFWAEVKYNFVFPERLAQLDWDKLYLEYIPKVLATKSTYDYYRVMAELCALLRDSHTNVYPASQLFGLVGMHTRLIEGRLIVLEVWDPELRSQGIEQGMEIVGIDGQPFREYATLKVAPYQSASTPQDLDVRTFEYFLLLGEPGQPVELTLQNTAGKRITRVVRRKDDKTLSALRPKLPGFQFKVLPGNIGYVALNSFEDNSVADEFLAAFDRIANTSALIVDVRNNGGGNSTVGMNILATLIDKPVPLEFWQSRDYSPLFRAWGRPIVMLSAPGGGISPDTAHHYSKPIIVLSSPRTFSAAEDFLVAFDQSGRGTIVGEPSAGCTGQPLTFRMPGGGFGRVQTWRGTYPSGKKFLGVGVQPQTVVAPTLQDIRTGRDRVLEEAIAELKQRSNSKM
jgi:C-terminal processing protease CtpA/Prc